MPERFRRWAAGILCALFAVGSLCCPTAAVGTSATSAALMDVESGRVLYASNANARMKIASTTKIMTALVAIERGELSDVITVKKSETGVEGTSMYLKPGEHLTLETLLYGLLLCSGNDAAVAIADHIGGSQEKFVALMNQRAKSLGMKNTSFANPNGLDNPKHYSTALDMARLACAAMKNETLARIVSTKSVTVGGRTMHNHNKLLSYMDGCIGLKTGFTEKCRTDFGFLCRAKRTASGGGNAAGRKRLGGSSAALRIWLCDISRQNRGFHGPVCGKGPCGTGSIRPHSTDSVGNGDVADCERREADGSAGSAEISECHGKSR